MFRVLYALTLIISRLRLLKHRNELIDHMMMYTYDYFSSVFGMSKAIKGHTHVVFSLSLCFTQRV